MSRMLTVGFDFENTSYCSIVLVKETAGQTEYKITVMNGDLQDLLTGNNVITEKDGLLNMQLPEAIKSKALKFAIGKALGQLLQIPIRAVNSDNHSVQ